MKHVEPPSSDPQAESSEDVAIAKSVRKAVRECHPRSALWADIKASTERQAKQAQAPLAMASGEVDNGRGKPLWLTMSGAVAVCLLIIGLISQTLLDHSTSDTESSPIVATLNGELATYVASGRALDVVGTEPQILAAWFSERLDVAPPSPPLVSAANLIGGRLCQIFNQRTVSYMYASEDNLLALYVLPDESTPGDSESGVSFYSSSGYATWQHRGWRYWLVGDVPSDNINQVARQLSVSS